MDLMTLPLDALHAAPWNPNTMSAERLEKLRRSVSEFGIVENLVVRPDGEGYQVLSGNQRLKVYRDLGLESAPCVIVDLPDAQARLLAQVLNRTRGEDDLGLRAALLRDLQESIDLAELSQYLPENESELRAALSVGETTIEEAFAHWAEREANRLHSLTFALQQEQLDIVSQAIDKAQSQAKGREPSSGSPRTLALVHVCEAFLRASNLWSKGAY